MKTLIIIAFLLGPTIAQAQILPNNPWYGADTAQSARLRGFGQLLHGEDDRLRALGTYQIRRQQAYDQYLDNTNKRIRYRWQIQDDAKARRRANTPNALDRLEAKLDMAERRHSLRMREDALIKRGLLPPRRVSKGFHYKGMTYDSYADFKLSDAYAQMIRDRDIRLAKAEAEKAAKQAKYDAAVRFLARRRRMNPIDRVLMDERAERYRTVRRIMGETWWKKYGN